MTGQTPQKSFLLLYGLFLVSCSTFSVTENQAPSSLIPSSSINNGSDAAAEASDSVASTAPPESPAAPLQSDLEKDPVLSLDADASDPFPAPALDIMTETILPPTEAAIDNAFQDPSQDALDHESGNDSASDNEETTYDVPIVLNESVEDYIEYFQIEIRDKFKLWLERSNRYIPVMREIFKQYGLPEDLVFVALIESGFNPYAYSRARAVGPWQFIKGTGRLYGLRIDNWVDERRDPIKSTHAAARYLRDLYDRFGSWPLAMAGYNAGEGKIGRALVKAKADDFWDLRSTRFIRRETKGYVPKFMAATIIAKNPERYGFTLDYHEPMRNDTVSVPGSADLRVIARAAGVAYEDLKELNPELRTELTPPYVEAYPLRLSSGTAQAFLEAYARIPDERKIIGTRYVIRRNDTLSTIAKRFGASAALLQEINHLAKGQRLREGDALFIPKLQPPPRESKQRLTASLTRPRMKTAASKKAPIQMAALDKKERKDSTDDGKKILYRVKDGDTLWDISKSFNVSVHDLKRYNSLGKRSTIRPGDQLVLGFESKDL